MSYYFISIGGSGAKVMESLAHLTVMGALPNKFRVEKLYVMAIDPDVGNGNLKRSSAALIAYNEFQHAEIGADTPLFKTEVELANPFIWNPTEHDKKLDDIMSYQTYKGTPIGNLYEALYTKDERNTLLNEGFRGRPSIGAAVMAKKIGISKDKHEKSMASAPWEKFAGYVKEDAKRGEVAKIFIAGSVFGGTGASGMPTIAKLLHHTFDTYISNGQVAIGGAMILPYFRFNADADSEQKYGIYASSENFLLNTKAALKYYALKYYTAENSDYNSIYFIGDDSPAQVKNFSVGASTQTNDAHMVDLYGAMAALDFYSSPVADLKRYSFISHTDDKAFNWSDFPELIANGGNEKSSVKQRMADFTRFIFFYLHMVKPVLSDLASGKLPEYQYPWYVDYLKDININDSAVENFGNYAESYIRYLEQIETSEHNRDVNFIRRDAFHAENITIDAGKFPNMVYDEAGKISIHEIFTRLAEMSKVDRGSAKGFGKFLRALYEACKND